jgi:hypothetical protein
MKIFLPTLHIKLQLIKCLVKPWGKTKSKGFQYLSNKLPNINTAELKRGFFMRPQIREILGSLIDEATWESLKWVCSNFLGRKNSPDFSIGIQTLLNAYKEMKCRLSLVVHFLSTLLDFFPENLDEVSDEKGEHFHQDIKSTEHRCPGFWNESMLADTAP